MYGCTVKGGGRNNARRIRRAERKARRYPVPINLVNSWTPTIARVAMRKLDRSGLSQRAFARLEGFPVSRLNTWKKRLGELDNRTN